MMSYRKYNIANEKTINYRVTFPCNNHCCQINIIVQERPEIFVIIHFSLFTRCNSKIFQLIKPVYNYVCILTSLYQFDKKLTKHFPANIYVFKVRIATLRITLLRFEQGILARNERMRVINSVLLH